MTIHQQIQVKSSPEKIYRALTSGEVFSRFTGAPAEISPEEGAAFSCFGGQISGRNIEMHENAGLVQAWRAGPWPAGVYSIVRITLEKAGDEATTLTLDHTGFPDEAGEHLKGGWHKMYWEPLKAYCE